MKGDGERKERGGEGEKGEEEERKRDTEESYLTYRAKVPTVARIVLNSWLVAFKVDDIRTFSHDTSHHLAFMIQCQRNNVLHLNQYGVSVLQ